MAAFVQSSPAVLREAPVFRLASAAAAPAAAPAAPSLVAAGTPALLVGAGAAVSAAASRRPARRAAKKSAWFAVATATRANETTKVEAWSKYTGSWEVHKFGGASLNDAALYKVCGELLRSESNRNGPDGNNVPTSAIVSACGGMTDELVSVVTTSILDPAEAEKKMQATAKRQIDILLELVPGKPELTDPVIANIRNDADGVLAMLTAVKLMRGVPPQMLELVAGLGEVWSAQTLAAYLQFAGEPCEWLDARDILIVPETDGGLGEKGQAIDTIVPLWDETSALLQGWWEKKFGTSGGAKAPFVIITGFVCSTSSGRPTTLKRSGSDYSATIFAKLLGASSVTMWKNVNGVYTADPRRVPDAFSIPQLTFDEAMELAYFGGQVLHPSAMIPCIEGRIPVLVKNVFNPSHPGTRVYGRGDAWLRWDDQDDPIDPVMPVKALTSIEKIALVTLSGASFLGTHGVARRMMEALSSVSVNVILTSQGSSEHSITVAVDESQADIAAQSIEQAFSVELSRDSEIRVKCRKACSILAVIGEGMKNTTNISGRFFSALGKAKCNIVAIAQGSSERNISAVVDREDLSRALRAAHAGFTLSKVIVSVGIIGAGKVGTQLMDQLASFQLRTEAKNEKIPALIELRGLSLEVRAVCDVDKMLLAEHGLPYNNILTGSDKVCNLEQLFAGLPKTKGAEDDIRLVDTDMTAFEEFLDTKRIPHKIIVDCTASEEVADMYEGWLKRGINVISPNKKMGAGSLERYRRVMEIKRDSEVMWFYDSTVGAQLPIISMLHDVLQTGDSISLVEGSLSGTFGYILDKLERNPEMKFSEAFVGAQAADLLEPDPREDLTGQDTARKALILARELGLELELQDVQVESIVPAGFGSATTPESWEELLAMLRSSTDDLVAAKMKESKDKGEVLRYISKIDVKAGTVTVGLRSVSRESTFGTLREYETVVQVVSERYTPTTPLVLRGAGAGSMVTASGVFATMLRLSRRLGS